MDCITIQQLSQSSKGYLSEGYYLAYCDSQIELALAYEKNSSYSFALVRYIEAFRYSLLGFQSKSSYSMALRDDFKTLRPQPVINTVALKRIKSIIELQKISWHDFSTIFKD